MEAQSQSAFEAELQRLGYTEFETYDEDPCQHAAKSGAVFVMPPFHLSEEATTHGELGWLVYRGCKPCCDGTMHVILCGGHFIHLRMFVDGALVESRGTLEPADAPRPSDEDEDDEDE